MQKAGLFWIIFVLLISLSTIETVSASWTHLSSKDGDIPEPGLDASQTASLIIDVDLDGINDFIITRRDTSPNIVWYRRNTTGWTRYVIENNIPYIEAGGSFYDIDGDGDPDIVFGGDWRSNKVWWWENPYPLYDPDTPWTRREIKSSGANKHHDQIFGDFDGDGKAELVFWNQDENKLFISDIPSNPKTTQPWPYTEIWSSGTHAEGLGKGDIDKDGKVDLIAGGRWFKHTGGTNYMPHLIDDSQRNSRIAVGDLIKGGNPEIAMVPGDELGRLKWYECTGDPIDPGCWVSHDMLGFDVDHGHSLAIADINNDGNLDIFNAEMRLDSGNPDAKSWIFYGNGNGNFQTELISEGIGNHESKVGDLDGDSDIDILGKPFNWDTPRIDVWLQTPLSPDKWQYHQVDATRTKYYDSWYSYFGLSASNSTAGKCKEIVSGKYFYKNPGCDLNSSWVRTELPVDSDGALFINVDNNLNKDIIAFGLPYIYWFEATDANETAWILKRTITLTAPDIATDDRNPQASRSLDINNDGRLEILFEGGKPSTGSDGLYALTIPSNPVTDMWNLTRLTSVGGDGFGVGDIDGDGNLDVTIGRPHDAVNGGLSDIYWYKNPGSPGMWTGYNVGTTERWADRFEIADVDGDGRPDILISEETYPNFEIPGSAYWFKNPLNPETTTWARNIIGTYHGYYAPQSMGVADMNGDGKIDVVLGEHQNQKRMFVLLNDGAGNFTEHLVGSGKESHGLVVSDIDNDGDYDIINIGWNDYQSLHLWENKAIQNTPITSPGHPVLSDDFNSQTLNTSLWTVFNPKGDATISIKGNGTPDALLSIAVPAGIEHDVWIGNNAPRVMQLVGNTDFEIELKFQSQMTSAYQMQGVIIQQDSNNYLRFDFVRFPTTTNVFAASFTAGSPTTRYDVPITSGNPLYLRVNRSGDQWKQFYSYDGKNWIAAANFNYPMIVSSVGPFAGNALGSSSPAFTGLVDYFFNTYSPIVPEDGGNFNDLIISIQPMNQEVEVGGTATFSVGATGTLPLSYQWKKNGTNISGATSVSYTTPPVALVDSGSIYSVVVSNAIGSITSYAAVLTVSTAINLVKNGDFESGTTPWTFNTNGRGTFTSVSPGFGGSSRAAKLVISRIGSTIQLYQVGVTLEPNTRYRLSFTAYSTTGHDVTVKLFKNVLPNTAYAPDFTANLGTSWQTFTTEFNTAGFFTGTVNDGRLQFWLAGTGLAAAGDVYYIDNVILEKIIDAPPVLPVVVGNAPNGTNVPIAARISVNFSKPMNQASVQSSFSTIPATTGSFTWVGNNMTYTPILNLTYNTTYNVTVGIGSMDSAGNNMLSSYTWPFTTVPDTKPPSVIGNMPTGINVSISSQINVTFSEAMNKSSAQLAFSTSPATTGSFGWNGNVMIYTPGSNLNIGTTYTATVGTGAKDLAGNALQLPYNWQFTTATPDIISPVVIGNTPTGIDVPITTQITALFSEAMNKSSVQTAFSTSPATTGIFSWSGNNMTYTPGSNLAFSTTYNVTIGTGAMDLAGNNMSSPNKWAFTTIGQDLTPPAVIRNSPTGTNVSLAVRITVNFSKAMNQTSVQSAFSIIPVLTGSFSWIGNNMTYTPVSNLSYNTTYNVIIGTGAKDVAGNSMTSSYTWPFITYRDTTSPSVIGTTPNGTNVPISSQITVTFSKAMNNSSAQSAFSTSPATTGSFSWSGNTMKYTPASNLSYNTTYIVTVGTGARDLAGNNILSSYTWQFVTAPLSINIINNPGFESATTSWTFYTSGTGTFSTASPGFEGNNAAKLTLNSEGTNIQLYQTGITLEPNTRYRLTFSAYSTMGHDVTVMLFKHVSPYTPYTLDFTANLGTGWQTFTTEFNTTGFFTGSVIDGRLMFWFADFAASGDIYYIDAIRLEKV